MKKALITGTTGQDGSYLAELLLEKGYEVHGLKRRASSFNTQRIDHIFQGPQDANKRFHLHYGDLSDGLNLTRLVHDIEPDEIYNLGAQSHVAVSFEAPEYTADVDGIGTLRMLEAIRLSGLGDKTRFYQASTSELFGLVQETPQRETTPFYPRSPYAVAKMYAYWITVNYRESYGMYACNGILFNHESPRRGETFVTRKITREISVRDFVHLSAKYLGITLRFEGEGLEEKAVVVAIEGDKAPALSVGDVIVAIDPRYFRPAEVETLLGDPTKAKEKLGWVPEITVEQMCEEMIEADLNIAKRQALLVANGYETPIALEN